MLRLHEHAAVAREWGGRMDFYARVRLVCSRIPYGKAATYGQIALLCGKPRNARQVGYALGRGLAGDQVPAYRIVSSSGILSGAAAFEYPEQQKLLLEKEGVEVTREAKGWRVNLKKDGWKNTLEDAKELEAEFARMGI